MAREPGDGPGWKRWAESVRLWVPIIVSCCAISLTLYQANATRRHNRLTVRPKLDWRWTEEAASGEIRLSLVNVGLGPAILKSLTLHHEGDPLGAPEEATCAAFDRRLGREGAAWDTACFEFENEYYLRPGDIVMVYGSRPAPGTAIDPETSLPETTETVALSAEYCSFYEECWTLEVE